MIKHSPRHTIAFMLLCPIFICLGLYYGDSTDWLLSLVMYFIIFGIGIRAGWHALIAHQSYKAPEWWRYLVYFLGSMLLIGPCAGWAASHRMHHKFSDETGLDPAKESRFRDTFVVHPIGKHVQQACIPLLRDPLMQWSLRHQTDMTFSIIVMLGITSIVFGYPLILFAWAIPGSIAIWVNDMSFYTSHQKIFTPFNYRNTETDETSTNNILISILTLGEGLHNNHHAHPNSWHFAQKWWEWFFDWPAVVIWLVKRR